MADPVFGISIRKIDNEPRPVIRADMSTIGLIGPAPGADASKYPLNTPVLIYSNQLYDLDDEIGSVGYLGDAIRGIHDQLGETQFSARIVVVRTAAGTNNDAAIALQETINNIVGNSSQQTGIWAFLKSAPMLGVTPRIICAPGYTSQMANSVERVVRTFGGTQYVEGDSYVLTFSGGGDNAVDATAHAIGQADGTLGQAVMDTYGAWLDSEPTVVAEAPGQSVAAAAIASPYGGGYDYQAGDTIQLANGVVLTVDTASSPDGAIEAVTVTTNGFLHGTAPTNPVLPVSTSGSGEGARFDLTWAPEGALATYAATYHTGANPVAASLTAVLNQLLAVAIVESSGVSAVNDKDWRETMQSERLIALSGGVKIMDPITGSIVSRPLAPRMAGILVRRDHEKGAPFHSAANQPIQGIVAPLRDIPFYLTDNANEAQELFAANIGCIVRGDVGNDFALASGGFILVSTDTLSEDVLWQFYNIRRGRDYIHLGLLRALRYYLGRYNIAGYTVTAILLTMKSFLRDLQADEHILGYKVNFESSGNSAEEVRLGHLSVAFQAEEPPVLTRLTIESARYRDAIDSMISELASQINLAAA
jgi:phage tail sheath protein FI